MYFPFGVEMAVSVFITFFSNCSSIHDVHLHLNTEPGQKCSCTKSQKTQQRNYETNKL